MMGILAYRVTADNKIIQWSCSDGHSGVVDSWSDLVTVLLQPCGFAVVYSLDVFVHTISPLFPKCAQPCLEEGGKIILDDGTKLYLQSGRVFGITYAGRETNFYGLSRYSDDEPKDASATLKLAEQVINSFKKLDITPTKLTSPVSVYGETLKNLEFPRSCDLPDEALSLTNSCALSMFQEWRDTYKVGRWDGNEVSDLDVTNCYGYLIGQLPDITEALFFSCDAMPEKYTWGEMQGVLTIEKDVSPFYYEKVDGYPKGTFPASISTTMLWLLQKHGIGTFQMEHGDFFLLPENYQLPFKKTTERLYNARAIDPMTAEIAKGITVGIGGQFAFRKDGGALGENYNSIYARMVKSKAMVKVADFIYSNALVPISVLVDGVLVEGKVNLPTEKENGKWRVSNENQPALVLTDLYQWMGEKKPLMKTYPEMMVMIQKNPKGSVFGDLDLNLIERKRKSPKFPRNGGELINGKFGSQPMEVRDVKLD